MNLTQTPMIPNNNQLQVEDFNENNGNLKDVSLTDVSQNKGAPQDNETDETNELDIQKHIIFTMRNQMKEQFAKKVTSLDELKRQYDRKMTAEDIYNKDGANGDPKEK